MSFCVVHTLHHPVHLVEAKYFEVFEITLFLEERFYPVSLKRLNSPEWLCKSGMTEAHSQCVRTYLRGQDSVGGVNEPQSLLFSFSNVSQDTPACEHLLGTLKLFSHQSLNSIHYQMLSSNVLAAFAFSVDCRSSRSTSPERIPLYAYCSAWRCSPNEARDRCP